MFKIGDNVECLSRDDNEYNISIGASYVVKDIKEAKLTLEIMDDFGFRVAKSMDKFKLTEKLNNSEFISQLDEL